MLAAAHEGALIPPALVGLASSSPATGLCLWVISWLRSELSAERSARTKELADERADRVAEREEELERTERMITTILKSAEETRKSTELHTRLEAVRAEESRQVAAMLGRMEVLLR